jgi:DNA helicase II / ATP-dependent DNA helicase PcrA
MAVDAESLLEALDPEQREVALATRGPVCVLAGAGTGKTRAITHRIAYAACTGVASPAHMLALTFTVRAAGELRGRLRQLGAGAQAVRASTFHAAALRQLTFFWPKVIGGRPPQLVESKIPLLREAARELKLRLDSPALADAAAEIEWAKVSQIRPPDYASVADRRSPAVGVEQAAALYEAYERLRRERQVIDFESVLELTAAMVLTEPAVARQVRDIFRFFTVDEYQDVNPLQKLLLDAWVGDRDDLCVVGDPQQTIYTFTGATSSYLRGFEAEFPGAAVIRLVRDYRSTPQVVALANRLGSLHELVAQRAAGPDPLVEAYPDEAAEAAGVAAGARFLMERGVAAREIAVLLRINAHMERFEHALAAAGVPYVVRGGDRFYERPEVRQALVLLRGAARAGEEADGDLPGVVRHVLATAGLTPAPPATSGAVRERWESLTAIAQLADDMPPGTNIRDFAAELATRAEAGHAPVADAVTLATIHAAKGLEWDAVFVPGLVEGIMPIVHARTPGSVEEERRLLYVAVTRAREHLRLSWPRTRSRSRFLDGLRGGAVA